MIDQEFIFNTVKEIISIDTIDDTRKTFVLNDEYDEGLNKKFETFFIA